MGIRKVGLLMEDESFEQALLRRFKCIAKGVSFFAIRDEGEEECDLIISEGEIDRATNKDRTIILSSHPSEYDIENMTLFKFQSSKSLLNDLLFLFSKEKIVSYDLPSNERTNVIGVYSKAGGSGVSSIALTMCYCIYNFDNKKVIYLNCEAMNTSNIYLCYSIDAETKLFSYAISQGIEFDISRFIKKIDGVDYLGLNEQERFSVLNKDGLASLIEHIKARGEYEYILVDLGKISENRLQAVGELFGQTIEISSKRNYDSYNNMEYDNNVIVNMIPIDSSTTKMGVHLDSEAFKLVDGRKIINHHTIFTSDIKKIVKGLILDE